MNLSGLETRTKVFFDPNLPADSLSLNGGLLRGAALRRVASILDLVRAQAGIEWKAQVASANNFPTGAGIASSASAFAALALAASAAAGLTLTEAQLSRLARRGSGSASRSIPGGFVEWQPGQGDEDSYAFSIAPASHWDLADCIAVVSAGHKPTGSTEGHSLADTSPLQPARTSDAPRRLEICRRAVLQRDFDALAHIAELDSNLMHAVMMTSEPILFYWDPATLQVMKAVQDWRRSGLPAFFTIDAGPNVHVICEAHAAAQINARLLAIPGVTRVLQAHAGGPARLITSA
jgi:diphosphomevalonate decarboxylase